MDYYNGCIGSFWGNYITVELPLQGYPKFIFEEDKIGPYKFVYVYIYIYIIRGPNLQDVLKVP